MPHARGGLRACRVPAMTRRLVTALRTIGVAIAIPEPHGGDLQRLPRVLRRPAGRGDPHPRHVAAAHALARERLSEVEEHLRKVALAEQPFELHLRGTGTFRPVSPVVFVQLAQGIGDCERIEAQVRSGPLSRSLNFHYHPHVTVAHDLPDECYEGLHRSGDLRGAVPGLGVQPVRARDRRGMAAPARLPVRPVPARPQPRRGTPRRKVSHGRPHQGADPVVARNPTLAGPRHPGLRPQHRGAGDAARRGDHLLRLPVVLPVAGAGFLGARLRQLHLSRRAGRCDPGAGGCLPEPDREGEGQINIQDIIDSRANAGIIALLGLAYAGMGFLDALRDGCGGCSPPPT